MNKINWLFFWFLITAINTWAQPQTIITNKLIQATLYLPNKDNGYYRGARFDWSGVIPTLKYKGHEYFGKWFEKYNPTLHDAIMGPVDGYMPVHYDQAKVGENFMMIGIGMIKKPLEAKWFFANPYVITNYGEWKIKTKPDQVKFVHILKDPLYSYQYTKTISLVKDKPQLLISYSLKNTGKNAIDTRAFNHNFFTLDNQITTKGIEIAFPYAIQGEVDNNVDFGKIDGNKIVFTRDFAANDHVQYRNLTGYGNTSNDYNIRVENHNSGACVQITADQPIVRFVFWSAVKTVCPEPYIQIKADPGKEMKWNIRYDFFECEED